MKMTYDLEELREKFKNKTIPRQYDEVILIALSHFPELADTTIDFKLVGRAETPYHTFILPNPSRRSNSKRKYCVEILEQANGPVNKILLKNLPEKAQIGILSHQVALVAQYEKYKLAHINLNDKSFCKRIACAADNLVVSNGFGKELYSYASHVQSVSDYCPEDNDAACSCLKPQEIVDLQNQYMGL
jgi:hypothetical protein